jgi:hypothetical protein
MNHLHISKPALDTTLNCYIKNSKLLNIHVGKMPKLITKHAAHICKPAAGSQWVKADDAQDTAYSSLRIWSDLNQDGISQDGELQTLAQAGIINLTANAQGAGSFTRTVTSTDGAGNTVTVQGAGMVRGLREAMSLGTVQAGGLESLSNNYHYRNNSELLNIHVGKVAEKLGKANKCRWTRDAMRLCAIGNHCLIF